MADHEIRAFLDEAVHEERPDVPFIVVATPVEEVGRDHDFDWAVLDVSSANRWCRPPAGSTVTACALRGCSQHCRAAVQLAALPQQRQGRTPRARVLLARL